MSLCGISYACWCPGALDTSRPRVVSSCEPPDMTDGNHTPVLCKNSMCT